MKKLFTLLTLLVAIVTGAQAADFTAPATKTYGGFTFLDVAGTDKNTSVGTDDYLCYGSYYIAVALKVTTWYNASDGKPDGNKENGIVGDYSNEGFIKVTETSQNNTNGNGGLKVHGDRIRYYYVTGATSVAGLVKDNGSSKYTQLLIQEVASDGTLGEATTIDGNKSTSQYVLDGGELDPSKYYKISFSSNNTSNCVLYQIRFGKYVAPAAPSITTQPQSASYMTGQTINPLTVVAEGTGTLTYQWYSCDDADKTNAAAISGAESASYTPTAAGFYYVKVTDSNGSVESNVAQITISSAEAPNISVSGAPAEAVKVGTEVILTAEATGTPTPTITWYDSNNQSVATIEGTQLAYTVPTNEAGTYTFYAKASNGVEPDATSATQTIIVKEQVATPTITPNGAYFEEAQIVELACTTEDAIIQYSTDNGATWANYDAEAGLKFYATTTLQAKATKAGCIDSEVATATFTKFTKSELASISGEKTWTIPTSLTLELTDATFPTKYDDYYTYSDIALFNGNTLPETFDGTTLAFSGQFPYRGSNGAQNGNIQFNTTVPGTVKIEFSNTGGSNKDRWVKVNDTVGSVNADGTTKRTETFEVGAGLVTITHVDADGNLSKGLRFYKIEFTPVVEVTLDESNNNATTIAAANGKTANVTVSRTLSPDYFNTLFLPFAMSAEQIQAAFGEGVQVATFSGMNSDTQFGFTNVDAMAANTGYLVKPAAAVNGFTVEGVTITSAASVTPSSDWIMYGSYDTFENSATNEVYYFTTDGKVKKLASTGRIKGLRAFMMKGATEQTVKAINSNVELIWGGGSSEPAQARADFFLSLDEGTTTGINSIENGQIDNDAPAYNLAGQKVGKGYKGIVIINGKKVVK